MKRNVFISVLCLLASLPVWAGPVSKDAALNSAKAFINGNLNGTAMRKAPGINRQARLQAVIETPNYYVFNVGQDEGFVIVSGSDKTQTILGYSDTGRIDLQQMPEGLRRWFGQLPEAVSYVESLPATASSEGATARKAPGLRRAKSDTKYFIPTLLASRWNQGDPYNLQCPSYTENGQTHDHSATGCVATGMAQVMYFWKWPASSPAIPSYSYNWSGQQRTLDALPPVEFKWDDMTDTYSSMSSQASKDAVSTLMRYVGQSINMGYGPASGAWAGNPPQKLVQYFDYDPNLFWVDHSAYTFQEWVDLIYHELSEGRPVLISGDTSDLTGGHEWVCDGYDGNGLFHQNWGWGGMSDGYFVLTVMSPDNQGIGGSTSSDGYSMSHTIVVGLQPNGYADQKEDPVVKLTTGALKVRRNSYSRSSNGDVVNVSFEYHIMNKCNRTHTFDYQLAVYDANGNFVQEFHKLNGIDLGYSRVRNGSASGRLSGLGNGTYYLYPRSRESGAEEWIVDDNAANMTAVLTLDDEILTIEGVPTIGRKLTVNEIELIGASAVGSEQKVRVNITNNGEKYYANTFFKEDNKFVSGNCISIEPEETVDVYFKYKPSSLGNHSFTLSTSKNDTSGDFYTEVINVQKAPATTIRIQAKVLNTVNDGNIYTNTGRIQLTVTNTGDATYNSWIKQAGLRWSGGTGWYLSTRYVDINLQAGADTTFVYTMENMEWGQRYQLEFEGNDDIISHVRSTVNITPAKGGTSFWYANGSVDAKAPGAAIVLDASVVAVSIPASGITPTFTYGDDLNPNTIVYLADGITLPSRLEKSLTTKVSNLVKGGAIEVLSIDDAYPFYAPEPIGAQKVEYTRPVAADEAWSTLVLPFVPETVTADGDDVSWFTGSDDSGKQLVVKQLAAADGRYLYFDYVDELVANRPYLVGFKGTVGESGYDLTGKTLVFTAVDATIQSAEAATAYTTNHTFVGNNRSQQAAQAYLLSADGTTFDAQYDVLTPANRAYFTPNSTGAAALSRLYIVKDDGTVGISKPVVTTDTLAPVYNLQGQRVDSPQHGVYIVNGRKVIL